MAISTITHDLNQTAAIFGCTTQTLRTWVGQGCPCVQQGQGQRVPWQFKTADVSHWLVRTAVEKAGNKGQSTNLDGAKLRRLNALASMAELDLARRIGEIVPIAAVDEIVGEQHTSIKAKLLSMPSRAAPLLVTCKTVAEYRDILDRMIREILEELREVDRTKLMEGVDPGSQGDLEPDDEGPVEAPAKAKGVRMGRRKSSSD